MIKITLSCKNNTKLIIIAYNAIKLNNGTKFMINNITQINDNIISIRQMVIDTSKFDYVFIPK